MVTARVLSEVPLFESLPAGEVELVAQRLRPRRFRQGDVIFHRHDPGTGLYIIVSGKVKIHTDEADGTECILVILCSGDFFGELAVLDGHERSATATAMEATEVVLLAREDLHEILHAYPRISLTLLSTLASRLRRATETYLAHSTLDVNGRLANQLLRLGEQHGVKLDNGDLVIDLRLTQSDLGAIIRASRESVNKVLGYFRRQGYVSLDDSNRIVLHNHEALRRLCTPDI
jgi:CRP/FNR family transcriptional regulator, cyclic AMP receptor protein